MSEIELEKNKKKHDTTGLKKIMMILLTIAIGTFFLGLGIGTSKLVLKEEPVQESTNNALKIPNISVEEKNSSDFRNYNNIAIVKSLKKSVVSIVNKENAVDFFNRGIERVAQGSGVIVKQTDKNIYILTNNHVVENSREMMVLFDAETKAFATLVGGDFESDLALLSVEKADLLEENLKNIKTAVLGDSDSLEVGEFVLAIGNSLGYGNTVTQGMVSGIERDLNFNDNDIKLIQTDAAINPGNSGGALVNSRGEVIGINSIKIIGSEAEGIAFAIPINDAKPIFNEILEKGFVARPFLGIIGQTVSPEASDLYELSIGVLVVDVIENTSASKGGILPGDVIIAFNNKTIMGMEDLASTIESTEIGSNVKLRILREGSEKLTLNIILGQRKN